ncbi:NAD(P)-dependent oxidoreductase [Antarcticimicrobium sediminis]|uniref:NAD(P)-dependent oxidoreductase n=1 Tax=Antarcticimicrobium sediminis TaxID=2546227 RepID=A0A4V2Z735_9RHOB|nr:NAD(P)-dependent oxidoreductase [Antarcticimicrobium sediminis]TDE34946.1 NAD(P)-dependent oxidoreductase [Antarcticimicrobium sediminis]
MSMATEKKTVGFIGLGIMGLSMAGHILDGGHDLVVFNRTKSKADDLLAKGATWAASPGEVAAVSDIVITIVGYPKDVEEVYLGNGGIVECARPGTILIDMTTSSPELATRIARLAEARGLAALDAPVSGGDVGAKAGNLAIMVGGDEKAYRAAMPIFDLMGGKIVNMGPAGAGQHTKMANQIAIASTMLAVGESLSYAAAAGLDQTALIEVIGTGAAGSFLLNGLGPKMVSGDYAPGFFVHHFVKDLNIALAEAARMRLDLPGLGLAKSLYDKLVADGFGEEGTQALYRLYTQLAEA